VAPAQSRFALLIPLVAALAACASGQECGGMNRAGEGGGGSPGINVPSGMSAPDSSRSIRVPEGSGSGAVPARNDCLERPPSYFSRRAVAPDSPEALIYQWADAWSDKDLETFFSLYADSFDPPTQSLAEWRDKRTKQISDPEPARIAIDNLSLSRRSDDRVMVSFVQRFETPSMNYAISREVGLVRRGEKWLIDEERVRGLL